MARLGRVIVEAIAYHYGTEEVLRRLSHPFWFQSFGVVMGMDSVTSAGRVSLLAVVSRRGRQDGPEDRRFFDRSEVRRIGDIEHQRFRRGAGLSLAWAPGEDSAPSVSSCRIAPSVPGLGPHKTRPFRPELPGRGLPASVAHETVPWDESHGLQRSTPNSSSQR